MLVMHCAGRVWPIPGLISCAGVTGGDEDCYLMHKMQAGGLVLSKRSAEAL